MRNKRLILFALCALLIGLIGCRPKGILHSGEMRAILADLHKTDGLMQVQGLNFGHDEVRNIYYAQVLEKHGITQAQFDSSIVWYTAHPVLFDKIYPKVQADLKAEHEAFKITYAAELHLEPERNLDEGLTISDERELTVIGLDSLIWVSQHGCPTTWHPWVRPFSLYR
jgi:hypothetical protein